VRDHGASIGDALLLAAGASATVANVLFKYHLASEEQVERLMRLHFAALLAVLMELDNEVSGRQLLPVDQAEFAQLVDAVSPYVGAMLNDPKASGGPSQVAHRFILENEPQPGLFTMQQALLWAMLTDVISAVVTESMQFAPVPAVFAGFYRTVIAFRPLMGSQWMVRL
jgi:hypothetical protein